MQRSRLAMARRVDDEVVILDVTSGRYFALNDVGGVIWDRLASDCSVDDLVDAVVQEFDIDRVRATSDVEELLAELTGAGLISTES